MASAGGPERLAIPAAGGDYAELSQHRVHAEPAPVFLGRPFSIPPLSTASTLIGLPVAGMPLRSPVWVPVTVVRWANRQRPLPVSARNGRPAGIPMADESHLAPLHFTAGHCEPGCAGWFGQAGCGQCEGLLAGG